MDAVSPSEIASIREHFGEAVDDDVAVECVKLCRMYNKSALDLSYLWEAMNISFGSSFSSIATVERTRLEEFKAHIKAKVAADSAKAKKSDTNKKHPSNLLRDGLMRSGGGSRPFFGPSRVKMEPTTDGIVGGSTERWNTSGSHVIFTQDPSSSNRAYRYMYEKISERSEVLDDRIEEIAQLVKEHYNITEFGDPAATTEEDVVVIGRITLDGDSSSSGPVKLNEASLSLETSRAMGAGARVPFRFDAAVKIRGGRRGAGGIGLFPGAIVALRGKNGGGGWFMVSEVLSLPLPKSQIEQDAGSTRPAFTMCIACGPFTTDTDLKFKPWDALLARLKEEKPDTVLLVGPFLDAAHPWIKQGDVDLPPDRMFRDIFIEKLQEYLDSKSGSLALIVPNIRDVLSDHAVFPQTSMKKSFSNDPRIKFIPNPCRFKLNGVSFAVSSVDVLFHLRKEEFFKRAPPSEPETEAGDSSPVADPMATLCRQLLEQRSYYPVFPVPQDLSHEVNLDMTHSEYLSLYSRSRGDAPEVLVTPSRLKQFAKNVDGTTFVNPSFLTKGTYASVKYDGSSRGSAVDVEISKLA